MTIGLCSIINKDRTNHLIVKHANRYIKQKFKGIRCLLKIPQNYTIQKEIIQPMRNPNMHISWFYILYFVNKYNKQNISKYYL